jgi:uncharacterized protein (DUF697 family)
MRLGRNYIRDLANRYVEAVANAFKFEVEPHLTPNDNIEKLVGETALLSATIAVIQPLPFADFLLLAPLHVKMALQIGKIKGFQVSEERAYDIVKEVVAAAGTALAAQGLLATLGKITPLIWARIILTFPITYATTWALGIMVDYYFDCLATGRNPSAEVLKDLFAEQFKVGKSRGQALDKDDMLARADALRRKVAARDPDLTTTTRMQPRPQTRPPVTPGTAPAPGPNGKRPKIKIVIDKKEPPQQEDVVEPAEPVPEEPDEAPVTSKTIGGDSNDIEIGFKPAKKTLGDAFDPVIAVQERETPDALVDKLERLAALKESGILSDDEFQLAKQKLLSSP